MNKYIYFIRDGKNTKVNISVRVKVIMCNSYIECYFKVTLKLVVSETVFN